MRHGTEWKDVMGYCNKYRMDQGYNGPAAELEVLVDAINDRIRNKGGNGKGGQAACFVRGDPGHIAKDCLDKHKGPSCYNCTAFGHHIARYFTKVADPARQSLKGKGKGGWPGGGGGWEGRGGGTPRRKGWWQAPSKGGRSSGGWNQGKCAGGKANSLFGMQAEEPWYPSAPSSS